MDIRLRIGSLCSRNLWNFTSMNHKILHPCCAKRPPPQQNGDSSDNSKGDKFSTDWDKAWSSFKKQGKKSLFSDFSPNKYVSWNPRRSEFPLSEEVDPIKRTERSNLMLWTSPRFTLAGAIVIVSFLLVYTILSQLHESLPNNCTQSPATSIHVNLLLFIGLNEEFIPFASHKQMGYPE
ncbi:hypothetical protein Sango_1996500 [Sesamum angolense]|uniref:Uncharacterized protein n=1 Tax=Sesamum angolense TaxID=2727404 RepID=A0AAE1WF91_9LAMI|nr:hypothetical protein Sango_1996500 [Sesamum angolense]